MQYNVDSVEAYFDALENDWREEKLKQVRTLLLSTFPELDEGINYKMLCYSYLQTPVFHLNAQRGYVGLYVGDISKIDPENQISEHFNTGKGCIRISKTKQVDSGPLEAFLVLASAAVKAGKDHGC
jgi:uncharacterized protein YdhG (YjbR/CyaY superfamily)